MTKLDPSEDSLLGPNAVAEIVSIDDQAVKEPSRKPKRGRFGLILKVVIWLLLLTIAAYVVIIVHNVAKISTQPMSLSGLSGDSNGRVNILILGEGDAGHAGAGLTDTIMVMSFDPKTRQIAQISVPRDLRVNIPGYGYSKINAANAYGGVQLAEQTVSNTLGIPINYYILTNFSGLKSIVDAVGGLDINVKTALIDPDYPCDDNQYKACGLNIAPGPQHMNGSQVLDYTRCRKGTCGNDFGRAARQQEVLGLLRQKVLRWQTLANPVQVKALTEAMRTSLTTNLGAVQMAQLGWYWHRAQIHPTIQLVLSTSPGGYLTSASGSSDLLPADGSFAAIQSRVINIFTVPTASTDVPKT
ncbi:LCP family protein [Candidatus Saccharibacteria bacterium]|nr:LCP family protein [Candidatus Saccharibacteria bacterium]